MSLYSDYRIKKYQLDILKKEVDELNKKLRVALAEDNNIKEDGYLYVRSESKREKLDEEALLEYLKINNKDVLKNALVIDEEELAKQLESGEVDVAVIEKFTKVTDVVSIKVKKEKEKVEVENGTF